MNPQCSNPKFLKLLAVVQQTTAAQMDQIRNVLGQNLPEMEANLAHQHLDLFFRWRGFSDVLKQAAPLLEVIDNQMTVTDLWTLQELIRHLTRRRDEDICFMTGPTYGLARIACRICPVQLEQQSVIYARAGAPSSCEVLMGINDKGYQPLIMAHSHPGKGPSATHPSDTDLSYLGEIQRHGSEMIGLIVARDGTCRFWSVERSFRVTVYGHEVRQLDENVYQIPLVETGG